MINIKEFFVLAIFAAMVGCGGQDSQQDVDQSQTEAEAQAEIADSVSADSIIDELDKTSQELKSLSDEAQKAIDDLSEDN